MRGSRQVSWNECTTIRDDVREHVEPRAQTNSARRRRSLHRGATRWIRDVNADAVPVHRVLLVALTMKSEDANLAKNAIAAVMAQLHDAQEAASGRRAGQYVPAPKGELASELRTPAHNRRLPGRARRGADVFPCGAGIAQASDGLEDSLVQDASQLEQLPKVGRVRLGDTESRSTHDAGNHAEVLGGVDGPATTSSRGRFHGKESLPRLRYFWWAEFQARGALHYHAIIVDPPFEFVRDARHWFDAHWELAEIQTWVEWRSAAWFAKSAGDYALKDVRKLNGKRYEQDYTNMPKGWRTFSSNRLAFTAAEHQEHETKAHTVCLAKPGVPWHERQREIYVYRVDHHIPGRGGCRLTRPKRPTPAKRRVAGGLRTRLVPSEFTGLSRFGRSDYNATVSSPASSSSAPLTNSDGQATASPAVGTHSVAVRREQGGNGAWQSPVVPGSLDVRNRYSSTRSQTTEEGRHMTRSDVPA